MVIRCQEWSGIVKDCQEAPLGPNIERHIYFYKQGTAPRSHFRHVKVVHITANRKAAEWPPVYSTITHIFFTAPSEPPVYSKQYHNVVAAPSEPPTRPTSKSPPDHLITVQIRALCLELAKL